jgi:hypothetical protein
MNRNRFSLLMLIVVASLYGACQVPKQTSPLNPTQPPKTPEALVDFLLPDNMAYPDRLRQVSRNDAVTALTAAQPSAEGSRADAISYLLVVLDAEASANRLRLIDSLRACARDPENCDDRIISYLGDLFERGDKTVLDPLLDASKVTAPSIVEVLGLTYQDMVSSNPHAVITAISRRSGRDQRHLCHMIATGDGSGLHEDSVPEITSALEEVARGIGPASQTAMMCINEIRAFAGR